MQRWWWFALALWIVPSGASAQIQLAPQPPPERSWPRFECEDGRCPDGVGALLAYRGGGQVGFCTATLVAPPDLAAFEGHFPQAAILPGVVLVDWAVRLGREAFGLSGGLLRMEALKFQQLVRPGIELTAELAWVPGRLDFRFTSTHGVHAGCRLRFDGGAA